MQQGCESEFQAGIWGVGEECKTDFSKACSITFRNIACRKLNNSSLVDGLDLISSLRGLKHKGILLNVHAAPLGQMVPHTSVGDKQFTSVGVTKVTKDVFPLGNYQATSKCFFIHPNI